MLNAKPARRKYFILSSMWALLLVVMAVQPEKMVKRVLPTSWERFMAHSVAYGIFAFLLCLYFRFRKSLFRYRMKEGFVFLFSFVLVFAWGGLTEYIQLYSRDRIADWLDVFYDVLGAAWGIFLFFLYKRTVRERPFPSKNL